MCVFFCVVLGTPKELAIWVIILVAIGSSVILLSMLLTVRHMIQKRGQHPTGERMNMDFEATPQDLVCPSLPILFLYLLRVLNESFRERLFNKLTIVSNVDRACSTELQPSLIL